MEELCSHKRHSSACLGRPRLLCSGGVPFQIKDGMHMANRTVTFTDFGEWSIHPRTFDAKNVNERLIRWITVSALHPTSQPLHSPCPLPSAC